MSKQLPWKPENIALLGTAPDPAIAKRLGVTITEVREARKRLRILPSTNKLKWGETELALLRSYSDQEVAKITGRKVDEVAAKRRSL